MPPLPTSPSSVNLTEDTHSLSEPSTDATASDLVGPGRLLGRLYGHIGHGIETRLNSLAERASRRRSRLSGENIEMTPTGSRPHRGSSSTASSSSSPSSSSSIWRASFTFSTVSSDETATNLPGAGRLLGNLYSAGGHLLESRLNRIANEAGRGPDACAARIKSVLLGEPYQDEVLMFLQVTAGAKRKSRLLPHEEILFKECRQLLRYAQYPSRSTHICAMEHITKLAINDRYLYTLFNALGASKLLTEVRKRELKMNGTDSDWAIQHCRKAIICLSTNEVNSVSHRNLRLITRSSDESLATLVRVLMKFLRYGSNSQHRSIRSSLIDCLSMSNMLIAIQNCPFWLCATLNIY
ncbi:hypothetical protein DFH11DRAFT_1583436 [Phellopilus nigrolimitatus]|nr:hypothetical protein DFH11DRAFT_1583436 [Phellopilus nigrolimitatus]